VDGLYDFVDPTWIGPTYNINLVAGEWAVYNGLAQQMYSISESRFPYHPWTIEAAGVAPAPYASADQNIQMDNALTFYTSVAGNYDYVWQTDNTLATASAIVTDFGYPLSAGVWPLPLVWPPDSVPVLN